MKKLVSVVALALVLSVSLFAAEFDLNFGLGINTNSGKVAEKDGSNFTNEPEMKYSGLDVHLGFNAELDNHILLYEYLDLIFVSNDSVKVKNKTNSSWTKVGEAFSGNPEFNNQFMVSNDIGVGYAFHFNQFRLIAGGGLHVDTFSYKFKALGTVKDKTNTNTHIGLNVLLQGDFQMNTHVAVMLGLKPSFNFYDKWVQAYTGTEVKENKNVFSLNFAAVVGMVYRI